MVKLRDKLTILAAPGLGAPHTGYEERLMVAGAKPVALMGPSDISPRMKELLETGDIVLIDEIIIQNEYRIYCNNAEIKNAQNAAIILKKFISDELPLTFEEEKSLQSFFLRPLGMPEQLTPSRHFWKAANALERLLYQGETPREVDDLLSQKITALPPFRYFIPEMYRRLETAAAEGEIHAHAFMVEHKTLVCAQADKIAEGKELFARFYRDGDGYPALLPDDYVKRVGELLGYTKNDTDFFVRWKKGEIPESMQGLYDRTQDKRRQARIELMLRDAPRKDF